MGSDTGKTLVLAGGLLAAVLILKNFKGSPGGSSTPAPAAPSAPAITPPGSGPIPYIQPGVVTTPVYNNAGQVSGININVPWVEVPNIGAEDSWYNRAGGGAPGTVTAGMSPDEYQQGWEDWQQVEDTFDNSALDLARYSPVYFNDVDKAQRELDIQNIINDLGGRWENGSLIPPDEYGWNPETGASWADAVQRMYDEAERRYAQN